MRRERSGSVGWSAHCVDFAREMERRLVRSLCMPDLRYEEQCIAGGGGAYSGSTETVSDRDGDIWDMAKATQLGRTALDWDPT